MYQCNMTCVRSNTARIQSIHNQVSFQAPSQYIYNNSSQNAHRVSAEAKLRGELPLSEILPESAESSESNSPEHQKGSRKARDGGSCHLQRGQQLDNLRRGQERPRIWRRCDKAHRPTNRILVAGICGDECARACRSGVCSNAR